MSVFPTATDSPPPPRPVATIMLTLLVLVAAVAIGYFAFGSPDARPGEDRVRIEAPGAPAGADGVPAASGGR